MQTLKCEMCGSNNLVKQDGFFVCQNCGCKYTLEEAKKMMIEGTVDVQGTVKVDNTSFVQRYLENARRAMSKEDWAEVEKYYNMVEQNEPTNIEAIFYSAFGKAVQTLNDRAFPPKEAAFKVLRNSVSVLDDNYEFEKNEEEKKILAQITDSIIRLQGMNFYYNTYQYSSDLKITYLLLSSVAMEFLTTIEEIGKKIPEEAKEEKVFYYKEAIRLIVALNKSKCYVSAEVRTQEFNNFTAKIKEIDPNYEPEKTVAVKSGCYVATCVYGSYDCPEVWTLRRYRDQTLGATRRGRAFIKLYYAISPKLVKMFGKTKWFKKMWKGKLDRMVKKLNDSGVENTPYQDKNWN